MKIKKVNSDAIKLYETNMVKLKTMLDCVIGENIMPEYID